MPEKTLEEIIAAQEKENQERALERAHILELIDQKEREIIELKKRYDGLLVEIVVSPSGVKKFIVLNKKRGRPRGSRDTYQRKVNRDSESMTLAEKIELEEFRKKMQQERLIRTEKAKDIQKDLDRDELQKVRNAEDPDKSFDEQMEQLRLTNPEEYAIWKDR